MRATPDVHYALRTLRRSPAFAVTAVLTLGAGLGLNTMLFTLFDAYVLRPVAVNQPYSLYQLSFATRGNGYTNFDWDQYRQIRAQAPAFSDALAANSFGTRVGTRSLESVLVSGNYFPMLRLEGRLDDFASGECLWLLGQVISLDCDSLVRQPMQVSGDSRQRRIDTRAANTS